VSKRDNKAAAAEFRELVGMEFDEFTRQAPVKLLVALSKFAEPVNMTVLQFADESHPLFQQQRERLARALRAAWQRKDPQTPERRRAMTQAVKGGHYSNGRNGAQGKSGSPPGEASGETRRESC
jgi:hypothetical protein